MKNLHKKISIGLLAALLVAGGSSLQGGKVFADSFEENYELADDSDALVVDDYNRESMKSSEGQKDLAQLQEKQDEFNYIVEKANEGVVISHYYDDVFAFSDSVEADRANFKGVQYIQIGLNVYKIIFNN